MNNSLSQPFNPLRSLGDVTDAYAAELLRNNVKEIIGSYHHTFDHLYECIQNAVDACERAYTLSIRESVSTQYLPLVSVTVDLQKNQLTVLDNGLGMSTDVVLKYFFTPNATLKSASTPNEYAGIRQRGEKGVGATFLSYGTNHIALTTKSKVTGELTAGLIENALEWCNEKSALLPMPDVHPCAPHDIVAEYEHCTAVTIKFDEQTNITDLRENGTTWKQWEAILRLYTAIGFIDLDGTDVFLNALRTSLTVISENGVEESHLVEKGYLFPHLCTSANLRLGDLVREKGKVTQSQRDMNLLWEKFSPEKVAELIVARMASTSYLRHKQRQQLSKILNAQKPQAYVAFTYSTEFWEECNHAIWTPDTEGQLTYGLLFFTKSQKLGEQKRIDFRFRSGDFNRFFILLDMQGLKADIGRKSLREEVVEFGNFFANAIQPRFNENSDSLTPTPGIFDEGKEAGLEEVSDRAFNRPPLNSPGSHLTRVPLEEQDVVALFFDLLGRGLLKGFEVYSTHISRTYDGVGRFILDDAPQHRYDATNNRLGIAQSKFTKGRVTSPNRCFIEFKFDTDGLVRDVRYGEKRLQDIKWLICWKLGTSHTKEGIGLTDVTEPAQINQRDYYGVTHVMTEGQSKVHVICLEKVLDLLKSKPVS